ncbi:uncharacterized protein LACBIDRAFT_331577 [Laccaria bicolor S238N-H82]|uniref:Predicted protein n=1 Tax=Laccaria bicolor (strain S238N-H82 / ATCC MYA-4686) TaxID=486041 RepID=B0DPW1_LACBS|nr:uncharacterized protein LACBIDRAFT_331577 [Laccaria bicolor S238N-H82]EDR03440.1 predicted protein [Laccaria bicolor S238N-H82]|eukprot:XP_001885896.1 predicted protein [Laccaria bicolor S238N-H82]
MGLRVLVTWESVGADGFPVVVVVVPGCTRQEVVRLGNDLSVLLCLTERETSSALEEGEDERPNTCEVDEPSAPQEDDGKQADSENGLFLSGTALLSLSCSRVLKPRIVQHHKEAVKSRETRRWSGALLRVGIRRGCRRGRRSDSTRAAAAVGRECADPGRARGLFTTVEQQLPKTGKQYYLWPRSIYKYKVKSRVSLLLVLPQYTMASTPPPSLDDALTLVKVFYIIPLDLAGFRSLTARFLVFENLLSETPSQIFTARMTESSELDTVPSFSCPLPSDLLQSGAKYSIRLRLGVLPG